MSDKLTQLYIVSARETENDLMMPEAVFDDKEQANSYASRQAGNKDKVDIMPLVLNTKVKDTTDFRYYTYNSFSGKVKYY